MKTKKSFSDWYFRFFGFTDYVWFYWGISLGLTLFTLGFYFGRM